MNFARKAVHWTKEDVRAAAAVLRLYEWDLGKALEIFKELIPNIVREGFSKPGASKVLQALLTAIDWDTEAAKSILIFVHEFRNLIEEAQQEEGAVDAGTEQKADGDHPDR